MAYSIHNGLQIGKDTPLDQIETYQRATYDIEQLRLEHNEMGAKYRNGEITPQAWSRYTSQFEAKVAAIGSLGHATAISIGTVDTLG